MIDTSRIHWLLWPFAGIWNLVCWILQLTGRLVAAILGLVFLIVGVVLTLTVIGAIVGVRCAIVGWLLWWRAFFSRLPRPEIYLARGGLARARNIYSSIRIVLEISTLPLRVLDKIKIHAIIKHGFSSQLYRVLKINQSIPKIWMEVTKNG